MKKIEAFEAEDGKQFFSKEYCIKHERFCEFEAWYAGQSVNFQCTAHLYRWLTENAEDIRGFLPPVAAKPEYDFDILELTRHAYLEGVNRSRVVKVSDVHKWLAGELK